MTIVLILILLAVIITWKVATKYLHWTARVRSNEQDCRKIDSHVVPTLTSLNSNINILSTSINALFVYLKTKDDKIEAFTPLFRTLSPIQLTPAGEAVLVAFGGKSYVDAHLSDLFLELENRNLKTALDVQNAAPLVIGLFSTLDSFSPIKNYIYKSPSFLFKTDHGQVTIPLDFNTVTNVMGIYLRNKYLETHPQIVSDWDNKSE